MLPILGIAVRKGNFACSRIDAGDFGAAFVVQAIFDHGAIGKGDSVILVGDVLAELIDQFDGDPVFLVGGDGGVGSGSGAAGLRGRAGGCWAHVLIRIVGCVVEQVVAGRTHDCFLGWG
jgi:hypothetical protein